MDIDETEVVRLAAKAIYVLHDLKTLQIDPIARDIDVGVSGHSHVPKIYNADGVLYLNPGSAGPDALRVDHHTCDDRRDAGQPAAGNPRSRRPMTRRQDPSSSKRCPVQMGSAGRIARIRSRATPRLPSLRSP